MYEEEEEEIDDGLAEKDGQVNRWAKQQRMIRAVGNKDCDSHLHTFSYSNRLDVCIKHSSSFR